MPTKNTQLGDFADEYYSIYNSSVNMSEKALRDCIGHYGGAVRNDDVCLTVTDGGTKDVNGQVITTQLIINDGLLKFEAYQRWAGKGRAKDRCPRKKTIGVVQEPEDVRGNATQWRCIRQDQTNGQPLSYYTSYEITNTERINASITYEDLKNHINDKSYNHTVDTAFIDDYLDFRTSMGNIQLDGNNNATYTSDVLEEKIKPDFEATKNKHKQVKELRNELDNKMRELYGEKGDPDLNLDSSVYSTMLFTIMTTSLLYFLFVKM